MSLSETDRAIIAATLPGNTSLTHFTDFRSSHEDLARLLAAVRQDAYKEGWNDREGDLIAGVNRIAPEEASQGAGEPVAWPISCDGPHKITDHRAWLARQLMDSKNSDEEAFGIVAYHPAIRDATTSPPDTQARIDALEGALRPFAEAAADADDSRFHDSDHAWESSMAMAVTYGDFRRARAALNQGADHD